MVIECKQENSITNMKDRRLIAVEDILEIEHTEGLKFELRYTDYKSSSKSVTGFGTQNQGANKVTGAIGGLIQKMKKKEGAA